MTGTATVKVTAQDGTTTQTYTINFSVAEPPADNQSADTTGGGTDNGGTPENP